MPLISINRERCQKDGLCARICHKVFEQKDSDSFPEVVREELCNFCGHCLMVCPCGAIEHAGFPKECLYPVRKEFLPAHEQVMEMIRTRRSTRTFLARPVERELIDKVIDGARFGPSAKNSQSTQFTVVQNRAVLDSIAAVTAGWLSQMAKRLKNPLMRRIYLLGSGSDTAEIKKWITQFDLIAENMRDGKDMVLFNAPILILFHAERRIRFAEANANLALQNATFVAASLGLGGFYTGYVVIACSRGRAIPELIGLPGKHRVYGGLALGYPEIEFPLWVERNPPKIRWI